MSTTLLLCLVIAITDGDTLKARCDDQPPITIRLAEIDAPENKQPFGARSKQSLAELCHEKPAEISPQTKDRWGRTVARVKCDGIDTSAEQVRRGMAWVFEKYVTDHSLYAIQNEAREAKRGLWAEPEPVAPWEWRKIPLIVSDATDEIEHGGGLNACGCHFNRRTGECHCHQDRGCGCACQSAACK